VQLYKIKQEVPILILLCEMFKNRSANIDNALSSPELECEKSDSEPTGTDKVRQSLLFEVKQITILTDHNKNVPPQIILIKLIMVQ